MITALLLCGLAHVQLITLPPAIINGIVSISLAEKIHDALPDSKGRK